MSKDSWETLKILTKDEIIEFLRQYVFYKCPSEREVKFFKWQRLGTKLQLEMDEHLNNTKSHIYAKKADELAELFNKETNNSKRYELLKKRDVYIKKISAEHREWESINEKQKKNDKLLDESRTTK